MLSIKRWNELIGGAPFQPDDPLPHTVCNWELCVHDSPDHDGECETIPASAACGELAFKWGMGPCFNCPTLQEHNDGLAEVVDAIFRPNPLVAYLKRKYG